MLMEGSSYESTISLVNLPVGYRFKPTEEESVTCYLIKKVQNQSLPDHHKIHEVNVYNYSPKELIEKYSLHREDQWYFFSSRNRKYANGDRPNRVAGKGYWKAIGAELEININGVKVASRKNLDYYEGSHESSQKTNWKMHEYVLAGDKVPSDCKRNRVGNMLNEWVLCKIYENSRNKQRNSGNHIERQERSEGLHVHDDDLWMRDPKKEDENKDGSLKEEYFHKELPPGYRFEPTEDELVTCYLMKKACNQPLPRHKIREVNVYEDSPQELTGRHPLCREDKWYFCSSRNRKYPNGTRPGRAAGDGFWKLAGAGFEIKVNGVKVATRKKLDYYTGSFKESQKTIWKMHEYVLEGYYPYNTRDRDEQTLNELILCKIYKYGDDKQSNETGMQIEARVGNEVQNVHGSSSQINDEANSLVQRGHIFLHGSTSTSLEAANRETYNDNDNAFSWDFDQYSCNRNSGLLQDIVNSSGLVQNAQSPQSERSCEPQSCDEFVHNTRHNGEETMSIDFEKVDELGKVIQLMFPSFYQRLFHV